MFERFTERARRMMIAAQQHAENLGHAEVGTDHLLLALMDEAEGTAAHILDMQSVSGAETRATLLALHPASDPATASVEALPLAADTKEALQLALQSSVELGDHSLGTQHLLLGLVRQAEGIGGRVLVETGMTEDGIRTDIEALRDAKATDGGRLQWWRRRRESA